MVNNAALTYFIPIKDYPTQPLAALLGRQLPRALHPQQVGAGGHAARAGSGSIVNISSGAAIGPGRGPYEKVNAGERRHLLRRGEGSAGALHPGLAQEVYASRRLRDLRLALAGRADAGYRLPPPRHRHGRPARRAVRSSWRRRRCCWPANRWTRSPAG